MGLKRWLVGIRDGYVMAQAAGMHLPEFPEGETVRLRVLFTGRVQHVGFRLEVSELARRLELTGWCRNLETGQVLAEFQGTQERILCLVGLMESLIRIRIRGKVIISQEPIPGETTFQIL